MIRPPGPAMLMLLLTVFYAHPVWTVSSVQPDIQLSNAASSVQSPVQLTFNTTADNEPVISADGSRIAFASFVGRDSEIFIINSDGTGLRQLTFNLPNSTSPSISGDGSRIVFESDSGVDVDVLRVNSDGSGLLPLSSSRVVDEYQPSISSNGLKVSFASNDDPLRLNPEGDFEIFVINYDGTGLRQLTQNTVTDVDPSMNADGTKVAFQSDLGGDFEIWAVNSDGAGLFQLTSNVYEDSAPSISANGGQVVFQFLGPVLESFGPVPDSLSAPLPEQFQSVVFIVNSDGSGLREVSSTGGDNFSPSLSGDGSRVAFVSTGDGNREIYLVNSDGSGLARVTNNLAFDVSPSLDFGGQTLAFASNLDGDFEIFVASLPAQCTLEGDVNNDGAVNIDDLAAVGAAFGSIIGDPRYNPDADLNKDGSVNIDDLAAVGTNFGRRC